MTINIGREKEFRETLRSIVLDNLENEQFGSRELAMVSGLSLSTLNRRLHAAGKTSANQFIREVRLEKAMELLRSQSGTASEIAYKTGFSSPSYFNKCFHEQYGYPPGEILKGQAAEVLFKETSVSDLQHDTSGQMLPSLRHGSAAFLTRNRKTRMVLLFAIVSSAIFFVIWINWPEIFRGELPLQSKRSIAVLPFKNFSENTENQYFADGIMEDILNSLFKITSLRVVSRTSVEQYRESTLSTREIGRQMDVKYVLEGSVRRYGDKTRISVQLIDTYRDEHVWSSYFDRDLADILGIQGDIAMQVARELNAVITNQEIRQIEKISTQNPEAYDMYLRGRFLLHKANSEARADFDRTDVLNSLQYYEQAIETDSMFTEAYAGLANALFNLSAWGVLPIGEGFPKARELSEKALSIDPECAEAHAVLGAHLIWPERRFEEGRKELMTSIELNPNFSTARQWYAQLLMITGPIEEARIQLDYALELEPYFWVVQNLNAWIYYFEEAYDKALQACLTACDLKPDFVDNIWLFVLNYARLGEAEKAAGMLQSIARRYSGGTLLDQEIMDASSNGGVDGLFTWLIDVNLHRPLPVEGMNGHPFYIAWWHAILGHVDESLYWLERNMETERRPYHYFNLIATNPDFDALRKDPRFLAIIDEAGLTAYHKWRTK